MVAIMVKVEWAWGADRWGGERLITAECLRQDLPDQVAKVTGMAAEEVHAYVLTRSTQPDEPLLRVVVELPGDTPGKVVSQVVNAVWQLYYRLSEQLAELDVFAPPADAFAVAALVPATA